MTHARTLSLAMAGLFALTNPSGAETYHVYYLGGQSNMDGFGTVAQLPAELDVPVAGLRGENPVDVNQGRCRGGW